MSTILVGYDPRARDRAPIDFGIAVAELTDARLVVASVQARMPALPSLAAAPRQDWAREIDPDLVPDCSEALAEVEQELRTRDIAYECRQLTGLSAAQALQELAQAEGSSLLVVGAGRHPVLGSTAQRLLNGAPCPVAAVPRGWRPRPLRTVAAAISGADSDRDVLAAAHALAVRAQARLRVITVVHLTPAMYAYTEPSTPIHPARTADDLEGEYRALAERAVRRAVAGLGDAVPIDVDAFVGDPGEVLVELSEHFDLLVCGSRGYGPLRAVLLGSVSRRLAAEAHCPVLVLTRGVSVPLNVLLASDPAVA